jgi:uncharacterized membrane protein
MSTKRRCSASGHERPFELATSSMTMHCYPNNVLDRLKEFKGKVLKTSLSDEQEVALRKVFEETSNQV